jgi:hypothetical protein
MVEVLANQYPATRAQRRIAPTADETMLRRGDWSGASAHYNFLNDSSVVVDLRKRRLLNV